jgi:hypothetical protein
MEIRVIVVVIVLLLFIKDVIDNLPRVQSERRPARVSGVITNENGDPYLKELQVFEEGVIYKVVTYNRSLKKSLVVEEWERMAEKRFYSNHPEVIRLPIGHRFKVDLKAGKIIPMGEASA